MAVKINLQENFDSDKGKTYKIGDTFYNKTFGVVMLVPLIPNTVSLIILESGLKYNDQGVYVESLWTITEKEFTEICDGETFFPVDLEINVIKK